MLLLMVFLSPANHYISTVRFAICSLQDIEICIIGKWIFIMIHSVPFIVIITVLKYLKPSPVKNIQFCFAQVIQAPL